MSDAVVVTPGVLREWGLPAVGDDKEARGRVCVLGGTDATPGAVRLAGEASLRAGGGKLAVATAASAVPALAVAVPEAAVIGLATDDDGNIAADAAGRVASWADGADVVLVGTGFSDPDASVALLRGLAPELGGTVVVDALGSAFLTEHPDGLHHLGGNAVLCVNPTELARTAGVSDDDMADDPWSVARDVARRSRVVVLCGGTEKHVVTPGGDAWLVQGGGPGLGVSGSGDVQAGIVAGLVARGAEPAQAATWGAFLHARAGERLAASVGVVGYLARELPGQVPRILVELG
jgi:ADP-dependent NAD(P)H-hydrate dehydratase